MTSSKPLRLRNRMWWRVVGVVVLAFLYVPILVVFLNGFNSGKFLAIWRGFSVAPFGNAMRTDEITSAFVTSVQVAGFAAVVATVLGTFAGVAITQSKTRIAKGLAAVLALALVTPEIVNAVALLPWYVLLGVHFKLTVFGSGVVRMALGHALFSVAVVAFIVRARVQGLDPAVHEAAADLYATPRRQYFGITIPLIAPASLAGAMVAFTLSLDNVIMSSFVSVQGSTTWPVYIWGSLKIGLTPEIAAFSLLIFTALILLLVIGILAMSRRRSTSAGIDTIRSLSGA